MGIELLVIFGLVAFFFFGFCMGAIKGANDMAQTLRKIYERRP